jgi:hypothetical protein
MASDDEVLKVDDKQLAQLIAALRAEGTGEELTRQLIRDLKEVAAPARDAARAAIESYPSHSVREPHITAAISRATQVTVHTGGAHPGVGVRVSKSGMPRGFSNAPAAFNATKWRHPVFGRNVWRDQVGLPGWFDKTMERFKAAANEAAGRAMDAMAKRIDEKTRG